MPLATSDAQAIVAFVGAGPGDPELLTVKGQRLIAQADVIIYADSLVPPEVCAGARPEATIYPSAALTLEETTAIMLAAAARGQRVVRLQSGDPSLYGALHEQLAVLDRHGVPYIIVPGVSSAFAAAAALGAELTVPEVAQTIIFTRHAGRVAMPEGESLPALASHQTTLAIFLSITRAHQVARELLAGGYPPETPVAVVYRVSWPDQRVIRTTIANLAQDVRAARIARQALILVGWALAPDIRAEGTRAGRSHLYLPRYTHLFRKGEGDAGGDADGARECLQLGHGSPPS